MDQISNPIESNYNPIVVPSLWGPVGLHGFLQGCMGSCGVLWGHSPIGLLRLDQTSKAIGFNYNPTALPSLWGPVGLYGVLWDCMGSYGVA